MVRCDKTSAGGWYNLAAVQSYGDEVKYLTTVLGAAEGQDSLDLPHENDRRILLRSTNTAFSAATIHSDSVPWRSSLLGQTGSHGIQAVLPGSSLRSREIAITVE
jgi:hypothetical protein